MHPVADNPSVAAVDTLHIPSVAQEHNILLANSHILLVDPHILLAAPQIHPVADNHFVEEDNHSLDIAVHYFEEEKRRSNRVEEWMMVGCVRGRGS